MKFFTLFLSVSLFAMSVTSCSPKGVAGTSTGSSVGEGSTAAPADTPPVAPGTRRLSDGSEIKLRNSPAQQQQMQKVKSR